MAKKSAAKRPRPTYRLPDGGSTTNAKKMSAAWQEPISNLTRVMAAEGYYLLGFDPGYLFVGKFGARSVDLPASVAVALNKAIGEPLRSVMAEAGMPEGCRRMTRWHGSKNGS